MLLSKGSYLWYKLCSLCTQLRHALSSAQQLDVVCACIHTTHTCVAVAISVGESCVQMQHSSYVLNDIRMHSTVNTLGRQCMSIGGLHCGTAESLTCAQLVMVLVHRLVLYQLTIYIGRVLVHKQYNLIRIIHIYSRSMNIYIHIRDYNNIKLYIFAI
jgi:hypothetical protein